MQPPPEILILIGGVLHLMILSASALVPRVLDWKEVLAPLPQLVRSMFWVHGVFIVMTIIAFGVVSIFHSGEIARGEGVGRSLAAFIAIFWTARLFVQFFIFDEREHIRGRPWLMVGYHALTMVFVYLAAVYAWAAIA